MSRGRGTKTGWREPVESSQLDYMQELFRAVRSGWAVAWAPVLAGFIVLILGLRSGPDNWVVNAGAFLIVTGVGIFSFRYLRYDPRGPEARARRRAGVQGHDDPWRIPPTQ